MMHLKTCKIICSCEVLGKMQKFTAILVICILYVFFFKASKEVDNKSNDLS
jgi:hypothetical protein